jgi:hypothetical protein
MQKSRTFWTFVGVVSILFSAWAFYTTFIEILNWKFDLFHSRWIVLLVIYIVSAFLGAGMVLLGINKKLLAFLSFLELDNLTGKTWKVAGFLVFLGGIFAYFPVRNAIFREFLPDLAPAVWAIWVFSLLGCAGLKLVLRRSWPEVLAVSLVCVGIAIQIMALLPTLTNYPFPLTWSEGSNLYYASLINAKNIYGETVPLSTLNPTYYFLRGILFFVTGLPIIAHRIWNLILWLGITLITSALFVRRLNLPHRLICWLAGGWIFLFLLSGGAVHYEVQICVIIILWGVSTKHPLRSLVAVIISSIWAGMSRLNWFPVPAMLALAIYLLEKPVDSENNLWDYLKTPVLWVVTGIGMAFISQFLYIIWSGNGANIAEFTTSFSSDLLWYRLLPNTTNSLGILAGIIIFTFPLVWVIYWSLRRYNSDFHLLRLLGLGGMLLVLFAGGIVVSTKIGGGNDLHNLDSFRILLALISASLLFDRVSREQNGSARGSMAASWFWPVSSILILVIFSAPAVLTRSALPDMKLATGDLQELQTALREAKAGNKTILFISQRQLLALGLVNAPLAPDYELIELTEMAMAGNQDYLTRFYSDMQQDSYGIIVADINTLNHQPRDYPFAEENNLWVDKVYAPLVCNYQPEVILKNAGVQVMIPRSGPLNCPTP